MALTPPVRRDPRTFWVLAGVFATALLLRLVYVWQLHSSGLWDYLRLDPLYYHDWAVRIARGETTAGTYEMTPLYAWTLGALFKMFGYGLMLPRLLQALAGAGTCAIVAWLGLRIFGRPEGLIAGLALAFYGPALFHEAQIMKTVLTVVLSTATAALLWRSGGSNPRLLAGGGALAGLTALAQENINITLPVLLAWIAWRAPRGRKLLCGAALVAAYVIVVSPATIRNYAVSGDLVLITSGGGEVFYTGNNEQASGHYRAPAFVRPDPFFEHEDFRAEAARRLGRPAGSITRKESDAFWWREGMRFITGDPLRYLRLLWDKITTYFTAYERPDNYSYYNFSVFLPVLRLPLPHFGWIAPFGIVGLVLSARRWPELLPLYAVIGAYIVSALLFFTQDRYRMPMVPLMTLFAAHAVVSLARAARTGDWMKLTVTGAVVTALAFAVNRDPGNEVGFEAQNHGVLGEMHLRAGHPAEAKTEFEQAIGTLTANPGMAGDKQQLRVLVSAHWGIVLAMETMGQTSDAAMLEHLRGAAGSPDADLRRDVLIRRLRIAESLHKTGDAAGALAVVSEALTDAEKGEPLDSVLLADAHYGLALIRLTGLPDRAQAEHHLRETLRLNPSHPRADWIRATLARMEATVRSIDERIEEPIIYTPPSRLSKSTRAIGWVIFVLALLARAACLKQLQGSPLWGESPAEAAWYVDWARRMVAGDWVGTGVFERSPFYGYYLGVVFKLFGPSPLTPRLIQIVVGSATCVLIQRIGRQAFTPLAGLIAGVTAAVYAPFLLQDVMLDKEIFVVFFMCAVVYQLLAADGSQRGLLATTGVCLGLAALARDGLILMAPVAIVWLMIDPWLRGKMMGGRTREGLGRVGAFAVGLLLVIVPVAVRNYHVSGETVLLTTAPGDRVVMIGTDAPPLSHGLRTILNGSELPDPVDYERRRGLLPMMRLPLPTWGWTAPIAFAGLILSLTRWREALVLYIIGGGYIATALLFGFDRYRMPIVPLMILFGSYGLIELALALWRRRFLRAAFGALALLAGIVVVNLSL